MSIAIDKDEKSIELVSDFRLAMVAISWHIEVSVEHCIL